MSKTTATIADAGRTYTYSVVVEPDEDAWHAWCPALQDYGAATRGVTHAEALRHIREVVAIVVAEFIEGGEPLLADEARSEKVSGVCQGRLH
jgi:predicted RNase H-like HicB family nuclease